MSTDAYALIVTGKTDLSFKRYGCAVILKLIKLNFKNGKLYLHM